MIFMKVSAFKNEIKNSTIEELHSKVQELRHKLLNLKLSVSTGHVKDNSQFKKTKKHIARVLTLIKQKESSQ